MKASICYVRIAAAFLAAAMTSCGGGAGRSVVPQASLSRAMFTGFATPGQITEFKANANGVTGGIALGYDGAVWFTQNNSFVGRFLNPAFSSVQININEFNFFQIPAFPILASTTQGIYTGVELDESAGFGVLENIVQITYARNVVLTKGVQGAEVNASMNAITAGGSSVYATGSYDAFSSPPFPGCSACLYVLSNSGKQNSLLHSFEVGKAIAYLNNTVYVAASESTNGLPRGMTIYSVNPTTFAFHKIVALGSSNINGMAAGPDNAVWFTDEGRNAIGRLGSDGHVTEFPLPVAHAGPNQITSAADGALWFTETFSNKIGRITTTGGITQYNIPTADAKPVGISALPVSPCGPRAVWFAETGSGKIGEVTY